MDDHAKSTAAAFDILRSWQWQFYNPDGQPFPPGKDLNTVATALALEGIRKPQAVTLILLCQGDLIAQGDFCWRKYQDCQHFQTEVVCETIKPVHWQRLARSIDEETQAASWATGLNRRVHLNELGLKGCEPHEWKYGSNRFSYAIATKDCATLEDEYLEEWYTAWEITVVLKDAESAPLAAVETTVAVVEHVDKGGRPPASDWEKAALDIAGLYFCGDLKPKTIADVGRALSKWLGDRNQYPSQSVIHAHAKMIFNAFRAWERQ